MTHNVIRIAEGLALPIDVVTQASAILAKRRAGKSYTARRFAEQLYKAGQQIVIVDPKGDWWGIRSSADGKAPGLSVVILGGERGDVPLEVGGGEVVAKLVVEERVSVLLDLSLFRKHEVATFMTAFLENLYRLKAKEEYRTPLNLIIDEADAIAPQKPQENQARMLGAAEDIVRRGGQRGMGCTLITQRSAVLNKNVLTQCEMIIALRTIAPQDLKAMDAWIEVHGEREQRDMLMSSLPALPIGDAWFWAPGWPTGDGIFKRVHVSPIETFDSGASPKAGEKRVEPKNLADVDLGALTKRMADTIERAKADDPKELRKQIAERDRTIRHLQKGGVSEKIVEKPVRDDAAIERAVAAAVMAERKKLRAPLIRLQKIATMVTDLAEAVGDVAAIANETVIVPTSPDSRGLRSGSVTRDSKTGANQQGDLSRERTAPRAAPGSHDSPSGADANLVPSEQKILDALAAVEGLGFDAATRQQLAFFAGYTIAGRFNNLVGALRTKGMIDYPREGQVALTPAGRALADAGQSITSLVDLHGIWERKLPPSEWKVLSALLDVYPKAMTREELAAATDYEIAGRFNNLVGRLSGLGAIIYPAKGSVRASDDLFPEGLA